MNKKHIAYIICTLLLILLPACAGSNFPIGTYTSESGVFQNEFKEDGSFTFSMEGQVMSSGTYSIQGNELTWETDSYCDEMGGSGAIYTWTFENDTLLFEVKGEDKCADRLGTLHFVQYHKEQ